MPTKGRPCCRAARPTPAASRSRRRRRRPRRTSHPTATCWLACSPGADTAVFQVADFDIDGGLEGGPTILGGSPVVEIDAAVHPVGAEGVSPSVNFVDGYQYCDFTYESYGWEDTGLGARPYTSVGRIYTGPNTAMEVGVYNGSQHRNEAFVSVGGSWYQGGITQSLDTSVDWSILFGTNRNVDLRAEIQYRHHQLFCQNLNTGTRRYPNVGEYYPFRPTGGTDGADERGAVRVRLRDRPRRQRGHHGEPGPHVVHLETVLHRRRSRASTSGCRRPRPPRRRRSTGSRSTAS